MVNLYELDRLTGYLEQNGYLIYRIDDHSSPLGHHKVMVFNKETREFEWDAICQYGSYGYEDGLLEIYGRIVPNDDVEGWLTADKVIERLKEYENKAG